MYYVFLALNLAAMWIGIGLVKYYQSRRVLEWRRKANKKSLAWALITFVIFWPSHDK